MKATPLAQQQRLVARRLHQCLAEAPPPRLGRILLDEAALGEAMQRFQCVRTLAA